MVAPSLIAADGCPDGPALAGAGPACCAGGGCPPAPIAYLVGVSPYKARRKKKPFGLQWLHDYRRRRRRRGKTRQGLFTEIYQGETWRLGEEHSHSGTGSSLERTETLRMQLPGLIEELGVRTLFDAPCGDLIFLRFERGSTTALSKTIWCARYKDGSISRIASSLLVFFGDQEDLEGMADALLGDDFLEKNDDRSHDSTEYPYAGDRTMEFRPFGRFVVSVGWRSPENQRQDKCLVAGTAFLGLLYRRRVR